MVEPGAKEGKEEGKEGGATPIVMAIDHLGRSGEDACVRQP